MPNTRLFLDISTLARSFGHADGITRTLRALTRYAAANRPDVNFIFFDLEIMAPCTIKRQWVNGIIDGNFRIDMSYFADPAAKPRFRERLPAPLKRLLLWIQRPRRRAFLLLERIRLLIPALAPHASRLQEFLMNDKYRHELAAPDGKRCSLIPHDLAFDTQPVLTSADILILAGSDWLSMYQQLAGSRGANGPKCVVLCYDIIPLLYPRFFEEQNYRSFRDCFHQVFPLADLIVFTAQRILADAETYCAAHQLSMTKTGIVYLGADSTAVRSDSDSELPAGLSRGKYALFVSTIEPRKGHRLLFEVWKRLLAAGVPQAGGFKLVFVGRKGWLVDELVDEMKAHPSFGDSLIVLSNIKDATLHRLYSDAGFCLYPSLYEGFGLPVIEAFRHGKAVIASTGGALPETAGGFSPCLDPLDETAWYELLKTWIENPDARAPFEQAIRSKFVPRSWNDAARDFFALVDRDVIGRERTK